MAAPASGLRVLLVDDNADALLMNELLIGGMGHEIVKTTRGYVAMEVARRWRPHVAFVDVVLPDIDGCDLVRDLKTELGSSVTAYILSAHDRISDRQRATQIGCDAYLVKPLDTATLERMLLQARRAAGLGDGSA